MELERHPLIAKPDRPEITSIVPLGSFGPTRLNEYWVHRQQWFGALGGDLPYDVLFRLTFDGVQTQCTEVRMLQRPDRPDPVTATALRDVPLGSLVRWALANNSPTLYVEKAPGQLVASFVTRQTAERQKIQSDYRGGARRRVTDEELRKVARVYTEAVAAGQPPTAAVQTTLGLNTRDQAKKRVARARKMGFLSPSPGERKGGVR